MHPVNRSFKDREYRGKTSTQRFWAKVIKNGDVCWEWNGSKNGTGYGTFRVLADIWLAHRLAWILTRGEIPFGKRVLHACDNPGCCNPDHLFLGTTADNLHDAMKKGRWIAASGVAVASHKLTAEAVGQIRKRFALGGITKAALARDYGISDTMACYIVNGKWWKQV